MKNFMILAAIVLMAVVDVNCHLHGRIPEEMKQTFAACLKKSDVSEDELMKAKKVHDFSNPKLRCLSECLMTEDGMLVDGKIELERVKEMVNKLNIDISEAEVEKFHEKCLAEAEKKKDKCDFATAYQLCSMKEVHKML